MDNSTKQSLLEKTTNRLGINRYFHKCSDDEINKDPFIIISPVQARLVATGEIEYDGEIISKSGRPISLINLIGKRAKEFIGGFYFNFYLNPRDKHYWVMPYKGKFVSSQINNGKAVIPVFIGLESLFKKLDMFERAIKRNASIGSILQTENFPIAMIAVGSLNVNGIHVTYEENKYYEKGTPCGYFNIGSSMLLCFPKYSLKSLISKEDKVEIGTSIVKILNR